MNCGIPYCHGTGSVAPGTPGCPVNNQIPDFNDLVYQNNWQEASRNLHSTNNFPEFTGRICPAPCEASCTLNITTTRSPSRPSNAPIVDRAWDNGWLPPEIAPNRPARRSLWSAPARPASPARSSSRAPAMTCMSTRSSPRPADCCATAFPISRWRSTSSTAASRRWRPRAWCFITAAPSAAALRERSIRKPCSPNMTRWR